MSHSRYVRKHFVPGTGYPRYARIKHGIYRATKEKLKGFMNKLREDPLLFDNIGNYPGPTVDEYIQSLKRFEKEQLKKKQII